MPNVLELLPEVTDDEHLTISRLIRDMSDDQARTFAISYRSQRKDPNTILLVALLGFMGVAGVHRFMLGQTGMGLLYLFTGGILGIGTIIDLVRHRKLALVYNQRKADHLAMMMR